MPIVIGENPYIRTENTLDSHKQPSRYSHSSKGGLGSEELSLMKSRYSLGLALLCGVNLVGCVGLRSDAPASSTGSLQSINHIIIFAQENRSFDHYFGALRGYWAQNGYPDQSFDGLPQFNPSSGAAPLKGPALAIPGCDPNFPPPSDCVFAPNHPVTSYHLNTQCIENPSPSWNESHVDWDYSDPVGQMSAAL